MADPAPSAGMPGLQTLLARFRAASKTEREKGTYFEELIRTYLRHEATYADLYAQVWLYADWAKEQGIVAKDTGIDLVAKTRGTDEFHAIQCKFYDADYRIRKEDIDSFFTASGQKPFTHRLIVSTVNEWTDNAEQALFGQTVPVSRIDLHDLEASQIDWSRYESGKAPALKIKKTPRKHQLSAIDSVVRGLAKADRGKLIMACGTGKTFTSLKIAEQLAGKGGRVLFLVPSLSLLSQSLTEWSQECLVPLHSFAVCSDDEIGKKRARDDSDAIHTFAHELRYPATTNPGRLAAEMAKRHDGDHMSVVFSTYHSIAVLGEAQHLHGLKDFDLIVCDEAHRTTGATFEGQEESAFVRVHDNDFLRASKRLYMTATPRIYADTAKALAEKDNAALYSMDDAAWYGEQLHVITFSQAVQLDLLCDYKVIVLTIDQKYVSDRLQSLLASPDNELRVDDAARIIGCWKALAKQSLAGGLDGEPMRRAVAFCQVIERSKGAKTQKVSSKEIASMFSQVVEAYRAQEIKTGGADASLALACEAAHVDGGMNAAVKETKLDWLKADSPPGTCRILSNVRCLSEGVDVPALDAVLFLTPRNSQVDVVQSVGRVMRKAPGKKLGYIILPVVIPAAMDAAEALNDNKVYKVVWEVLQALRSHDDRFDAFVNKLDLAGGDPRRMEVVAISDTVPRKTAALTSGKAKKTSGAHDAFTLGGEAATGERASQGELQFQVGELEKALYARVVKKCGNRTHWEEWAKDIADIAGTHITRITSIVQHPDADTNLREKAAFKAFADELRDDLNGDIRDEAVIEMLAQHLITKPVFDALFGDYSFAGNNPVSLAMQAVLDLLQEHRLDKEADTLEKFYASVRMRAEGIDSIAGKQTLIKKLYDSFFSNAFTKTRDALGIVYTPVEVVDFIIHSVNDLLKQEFGKTLADEGVHILDPFTGTGTFITRLLQSGLIPPDRLAAKYGSEIHANEIVLLAYYIAAINIEAVYHALAKEQDSAAGYTPFSGICLTDTFRLGEEDLVSALLAGNSDRRKRQQKLDVRVILGNPPYSAGQESANDNNQNVEYPALDRRITETYATGSKATLQKGLYDSYIRAIRWASDRIGKSGVIGFVTNGGFLDSNSADGLRKCLADEFSSIHVFHLRGNQRTSGELSRKEGGKIFGSGSRAPIAISLLVKNPDAKAHGQIRFHDIGDYLTAEQKLKIIADFKSIDGITAANGWCTITPDKHGDWLKQRDDSFSSHIAIGDKKGDGEKIFENFSLGISTARDMWVYNPSKAVVAANMSRMIKFYNEEVAGFQKAYSQLDKKTRESLVHDFVNNDPTRISWTVNLKEDLVRGHQFEFEPSALTPSLYRPYSKQWLYYNRDMNERVLLMPRIFPDASAKNRVIGFSGIDTRSKLSVLMTDCVPCIHAVDMVGSQYFPLYLYDTEANEETAAGDMFTKTEGASMASSTRRRRDAITDTGLAHFQTQYPEKGEGETLTKEALFYYTYGLLHSPDYREKFADNLAKELPRIPAVKTYADFRAFETAGRALAELHLGYETITPHAGVTLDLGTNGKALHPEQLYRVTKMRFPAKDDKSTVTYNEHITLRNIPLAAYDYIVNGKPALEWVMELQCVDPDKKSGITNDANLYATETVGDPRYPLDLLRRVVTVSLETMKIVKALPKLEI